jgi:hypothetical protein
MLVIKKYGGCGLDLAGSELGSVSDSCEHVNET